RMLVKVPFSTADLEAWEKVAKNYRGDPIGTAEKFKFMIKQHNPDWGGIQLMLEALTETEKQLVLKTAGDLAEDSRRGTDKDIKEFFPLQDLNWDPNSQLYKDMLENYQKYIIKGIERVICKTINWSALYAVKQGPLESPSEFLD
ncbi:hypothetical protein N302_07314, partial [Corvus brachyrhynchos]